MLDLETRQAAAAILQSCYSTAIQVQQRLALAKGFCQRKLATYIACASDACKVEIMLELRSSKTLVQIYVIFFSFVQVTIFICNTKANYIVSQARLTQ